MEEEKVIFIEDFVTKDSLYLIEPKDVENENQSLLDTLITFEKEQSSVKQKNIINTSKIDDSDEDDSCNIEEEGRDEDDKNSSYNEENDEDEAMFETKIEVECHGVQYDKISSNKKLFKCEICRKEFKAKQNLIRHHMYVHKKHELDQFKCSKCEFKTVNKNTFNTHFKIHNKKTYLKCTFCHYSAAQLVQLNAHIVSKHKLENKGDNKIKITSKIHTCTKCSYSTVQKTNYDNHIKVCLKLKNVKWHQCPICHYQTLQKSQLTAHIKNHHNKKQLKCLFCEYQNSLKISLDNHILTNHLDLLNENNKNLITSKTHCCYHCNFKTTFANSFKRHLKLKHGMVHPGMV